MQIMNLYLSYFSQSSQIGQIHVKRAPLRVIVITLAMCQFAQNGKAKMKIFS